MTMIPMFQVNSAFALQLIALAVAMGLIVWMRVHKEHTTVFCRGIAYLIVILAFLSLICTSYHMVRYRMKASSSCPCREMMMQRMQGSDGMMKDMKQMKQMKQMRSSS
jgi:hypothetical protein